MPEPSRTSENASARTVDPPGLSAPLVVLLAVACGVSVATNYYAQALLPVVGSGLRVDGAAAGWLVTVGQLGFAVGLVTLVPLGDLLPRHRLVPVLLLGTAAALAGEAVAPTFAVMLAAAAVAGGLAVAVQILVPLAAGLAAPGRQGRVVGQVMSGLLLGVLLARTVAGLLSAVAGWRAVYAVAAGAVVMLAAVLAVALPRVEATARVPYRRLLASIGALVRTHATLRRRAAYGALTFAGFGALWTTVAFLLAGPPYRYGEATIGLFGLVGAAGALIAQGAGRLVDAGRLRAATGAFLAVLLAGWAVAAAAPHALAALIAAMILIDLGVQGMHIANQSAIYRLDPAARSRLTTVYMTAYFAGGALGSAGAVAAYTRFGWPGVTVLGGTLTLAGLSLWTTDLPRHRRRRRRPAAP